MNQLEAIAAKFGKSEPVFKITVASNGRELTFDTKDAYDANQMATDDPVTGLLISRYTENLNKREAKFEPYVDVNGAYFYICRTFIDFTLHNYTQKNPKQSKLFKWLNTLDIKYNQPLSDGFVALYRYAITNDTFAKEAADPHAKNILAILELMREKYEPK